MQFIASFSFSVVFQHREKRFSVKQGAGGFWSDDEAYRPFGEAEGVKLWQHLPLMCSAAVCPAAAQTGSEPIAPPLRLPQP